MRWKYFLRKAETYLKLPLQKKLLKYFVVKLWPFISPKLGLVATKKSEYFKT